NSEVSITGSNKPKLSEAEDYTLSNHDTGKHPLPPLEKLTGVELVSGPKTIKSILKSKSTFKAETLKGITINEPSSAPARGNKSSSVSKTNSAPAEQTLILATTYASVLSRKDMGENIMIGPIKGRTVSDGNGFSVITGGTEVQLNQGDANENRIMMERFGQPNTDPLALVSDVSAQQYPTQSSKSPNSTEPYPSDNFQMNSGNSSKKNLIESLTTHLLSSPIIQSTSPQTNNSTESFVKCKGTPSYG
ncbi:hypothetical protein Tco_1369691, partial [Tanacetum coccineum]